ncbi:uncharacterized protein DUF1353 [Alteromonadaceae bacterium 2753L.S.0a.02]|nr:uncharacterized protein DUF1353 [Alteromonadaceae bacterium 2753L.S.0a.02]
MFTECLCFISKDSQFELAKPLNYYRPEVGTIKVPTGFETDFASIPAFARVFFAVNGKHRQASVLHDYLYSKKGRVPKMVGETRFTRKQCDQEYLTAMKGTGVSFFKRWVFYGAVRLGGWIYWNRKTNGGK